MVIMTSKQCCLRAARFLLGVQVGEFKPDDETKCTLNDTHDYFTAFVDVRSHRNWITDVLIIKEDGRSNESTAMRLYYFMLTITAITFLNTLSLF